MNPKLKALIIGPGNIGTDLLMKILRSPWIEAVWMVGVDPNSAGLERARQWGVKTTADGIDAVLPHIVADDIRIAFDATSAYAHAENSRKLNELGVMVVDLTPAAIGPFCVPPVNLMQHKDAMNVNMVTCGGQATIPMVAAVSRVQEVEYAEIVATVSSRSVGAGTRQNIDEFTHTTARAIESVGGAKKGKAIIVINPAEPPLMMRDTVHCVLREPAQKEALLASIEAMVEAVQQYVAGYQLKEVVVDNQRVSIYLEVAGLGDFLPKYAGNLDIMTAAALQTAEMLAQEVAACRLQLMTR
ncbi:MAG: acetaldehyde dehydrogenase (acetylating) [Neisseria sp.]|nr:acetaldehyde dehydrogenase (acetylating) [Neisseria sp.]